MFYVKREKEGESPQYVVVSRMCGAKWVIYERQQPVHSIYF